MRLSQESASRAKVTDFELSKTAKVADAYCFNSAVIFGLSRLPGHSMLLPSQVALLTSLIGYPAILRLCARSQSPEAVSNAGKVLSTVHSSLLTILALYVLSQHRWHSSSPVIEGAIRGSRIFPLDDSVNPAIQTRSEFANAITAIECGYLLQDSVVLILSSRLNARAGKSGTLDKTLLTHHVGIGLALATLQYYIAIGKEKGIYIIIQFLLMNASTPLLNLRWYLRTFRPQWKKVRMFADATFVVAFFAARVWLIQRILEDYGKWHGWSAWETYQHGLRLPCQLGTGALWLANAGWWSVLVWNTIQRSTQFTLGGH